MKYDIGVRDVTGEFVWIESDADCKADACEDARHKAWDWCYFEDPTVYQVVDLDTGQKSMTRP